MPLTPSPPSLPSPRPSSPPLLPMALSAILASRIPSATNTSGWPPMMSDGGWWSADGLSALRDELTRPSSSPRIAVVGSSGNLLYHASGAAIDGHDLVVRINAPTIAGYENDVGRRTHVRVTWGNGDSDGGWGGFGDALRKRVIEQTELTLFVQNHIGYSSRIVDVPSTRRLRLPLVVNNHWMAHLARQTLECDRCVPSTGFQALSLIVAMSRELGWPPPTAYGFGRCAPCGTYYNCDGSNSTEVDLHAFHDEGLGRNGWHAFATEHDVRLRWHEEGLINLVEPSCTSYASHYQPLPPAPPMPPPATFTRRSEPGRLPQLLH